MTDVVIASGARPAIGSSGRGLASVPAHTVNRLCGNGVQPIMSATHGIETGKAQGIATLLGRR